MTGAVRLLGMVLLLACALLVGVVVGAGTFAAPRPTETPPSVTPRPTPRPTPVDTSIRGAAVVIPARTAELAVGITGRVADVFVAPDQTVRADQLLLRLDDSARQAAVAVARADVRRARAAVQRALTTVETLPEDASPAQVDTAAADLRLAEAEVEVAATALAEAQVALGQTELRAPWSGTVAEVHVVEGEQAVAGAPLITLADTSAWLLQTSDLTELQVVRISVGDPVTITLDAMPDVELAGRVARVQVRGTNQQGAVRFDVLISFDEHRSELRWNMGATVRIAPAR